jgi:hypothetical protein
VHLRFAYALQSFVVRSDDRRLDRLAGSRVAQGLAVRELARRFDPAGAGGFVGDLQFELRRADGRVRPWTLTVEGERASARSGPAERPVLTVSAEVADVLRMATGELQPASALLTGRLDLSGDWGVAMRLGRMFRAPA